MSNLRYKDIATAFKQVILLREISSTAAIAFS